MNKKKFNDIKRRLNEFETPVEVEGFDPFCTCGSLVPECDTCKQVNIAWSAKWAEFKRTAVSDIKWLIQTLEKELGDEKRL